MKKIKIQGFKDSRIQGFKDIPAISLSSNYNNQIYSEMNTYLKQLISEMRHAATLVPEPLMPEGSFDTDFVVATIQRFPEQTMGDWFGLEIQKFPEAEFWNEDELELLAAEFEKLWEAWSFYPEFPEGIPAKMRYTLLRNHLSHSCEVYLGGPKQHNYLCNFRFDECPFGPELCLCRKMLEENTVYA